MDRCGGERIPNFKNLGQCLPQAILHRLSIGYRIMHNLTTPLAHTYLKRQNSPDTIEQLIRFLSKTLTPVQIRWSTIEKEAYAIYYALEDLLGGQTIITI